MDKKLLFELGFLREQDLTDNERCKARWKLFKTIPQKKVSDVSGKKMVDNKTTI